MIIDKIYVSSSRPSTTNILWVKPLANGEFALYAFLKGKWSLLRIMKSGGTSSPDDDTPEEEGEGYTKEETDNLFLRKRVAQGKQYAERGLATSMVNTIDGVGTLSTNAYAGGIIIGNNTNMLTLSPNEIVKSVAYGSPISVVWADTLAEALADKEDITPIEAVTSGTTAITAQVNKYYEVAGTVSSLTITLPTPTTNTEVTMVVVHFTAAANNPVVFVTSSATVAYSAAYAVVANKEYELSCLYNGSKWIVSSMEVAV